MTILLGGVVLYAWLAMARVRFIGLLFGLLASGGLYFVWFQGQANKLAHLAGIGRGVDLFIYIWIAVSLLAILNVHLVVRLQSEKITALVRRLAILEATLDEQGRTSGHDD
ncbi:MAG: hypothetical protein RIS94_103 [Pseudomonadota bacterium]|jgi:hypothetical protein